jgi:uncharacterized protein YndB with AHSA1/START domain
MAAMTSSRTATVTLPTDTQILITRDFSAPKDLVFKAYTTPELIERWWTAKRGSMKVCEVDLRVGGKWRYVMEAEGGFEVAFHGEYREIVPNERLVSTEVFEGAPVPEGVELPETLNTLTLEEVDGRTRMTLLVDAPDRTVRDAIVESGMEDGLQDALDLLEDVAVSLS